MRFICGSLVPGLLCIGETLGMQKSLGTKLVFELHVLPPMHELVQGSDCAIGQCNATTIMKSALTLCLVCVATSSPDMVFCFKSVQRKVCYVFKE